MRELLSLTVASSGTPGVPVSLQHVEELSRTNSLYITWEPGDDGGAPQSFLISHRINRKGEEYGPEQGVGDALWVNVTGLEPNTEYEIRVTAVNDIGKGESASITGTTYRKYLVYSDVLISAKFNMAT